MTGDKSDNVPGVRGIGDKIAADLLKKHNWFDLLTLADTGDAGNEISPPGVRSKLIDNIEDLLISHDLVYLRDDAPIEIESIFKRRVTKPQQPTEEIPTMDDKPAETKPEPIEQPETPKPKATTAIVKSDWNRGLEPTSADGAFNLSRHLDSSGLYRKFPNMQSIFAVILRGRALGLDATTALDGFHIVEGRPSLSAPLMVGLVMKSDKCDYFKCIETSPESATYTTHRSDDPDPEPQKYTYTIEQAGKAELLNKTRNNKTTNWHKRPETMLRWRCATELARMVYPDIVAGLYTPDELSNGEYIEADCEVVDG